ncbi:MAG: hypothetical protein AAF253_02075 [Pseudomonadota bacterium]
MDSQTTGLSDETLQAIADRPSVEFDEVVLQADYAARAAISFYRFRQLGGGRDIKDSTTSKPMAFGSSAGRGIHYISDHPQVRLLNLSVVALLVLFESAANAYFFAQQSEFGISGGLFQAAAVSLANVATSYFIIGFWGLRHASMPTGGTPIWRPQRRDVIRLFGIFAIVIGVVMVLLVNLSAAHYRNIIDLRAENLDPASDVLFTFPRFWMSADTCSAILGSEIGASIGSAATSAMCRPFALHSLDAMVLFALGLAISAIAAFEGRRADSAFPGFSDAARSIERARRDLLDALDDYYDSYADFIDDQAELLGIEASELTPTQRAIIVTALDKRVESYRALLSSDADILRDEFDVPREVVERIADTARMRPSAPAAGFPPKGTG